MNSIAIIENNILASITIRLGLINGLKSAGHKVVVLTTGEEKSFQRARKLGVDFLDIGSSTNGPLEIVRYIVRLGVSLKKINPSICLTFTIRPAIWGNLVTRLLNIKTISNITGIGPLFVRQNIAYIGARILYKFALQKTSYIIFQNEEDRNIFLSKGYTNEKKALTVPGSGVDTDFYAPRPQGKKVDEVVFLFIGRLVYDKGIREYVEAAKKYRLLSKDAIFKIIGPLWKQNLKDNTVSEETLNQWIKEESIFYEGEKQDVRDDIAAADCIVLPSYREGMSNVLLEACSMERPCVTTDTTGCRDIIVDGLNGFLAKVGSSNSLLEAIKKMALMSDIERMEMGKRGRKRVVELFQKKVVIATYLKAIEGVMSESKTNV